MRYFGKLLPIVNNDTFYYLMDLYARRQTSDECINPDLLAAELMAQISIEQKVLIADEYSSRRLYADKSCPIKTVECEGHEFFKPQGFMDGPTIGVRRFVGKPS